MNKKNYLAFVLIGVMVVAVSFLFRDPDVSTVAKEDREREEFISKIDRLEKEVKTLTEDNLELKREVSKLQIELVNVRHDDSLELEYEWLKSDFFNVLKQIVDLGFVESFMDHASEFLLTFTTDEEIIGLYKPTSTYNLPYELVYLKKGDLDWTQFSLDDADPDIGINAFGGYSPFSYQYSGFILDPTITSVLIKIEDVEHEARILEIGDGLRAWFSSEQIESENVGFSSEYLLKVEALNQHGEVVWKEGQYDGQWFSGRADLN